MCAAVSSTSDFEPVTDADSADSATEDSSSETSDSVGKLLHELGSALTPLTSLELSEDFIAHIAIGKQRDRWSSRPLTNKERLTKRARELESETLSSAKINLVHTSDTLNMLKVQNIVGELGMSVFLAAGAVAEGGSSSEAESASSSVLDKPVDSDTTSGILEAWSLAVVRMLCTDNSVSGSADLLRPDKAVAAAVAAEATLQAMMADLSPDGEEGPFLADTELQERLSPWEVLVSLDLSEPGGDPPEWIAEYTRMGAPESDDSDARSKVAVPLHVVYHVFESMTTVLKAFRVVVDTAEADVGSECQQYRKDIRWLTKHWHWAFEQTTGVASDVMHEIAAMETFPWEADQNTAFPTLRRSSSSLSAGTVNKDSEKFVFDADATQQDRQKSDSDSDSGGGWTAAGVAEAVGEEKTREYNKSTRQGVAVPVWMQALSREQVCEYFVKQRDEFFRVRDMLTDRELARKAAEDQFGSLDQPNVPGSAAQYADPNVVWEQQEVLADVYKNMDLLYDQVAARLRADINLLISSEDGGVHPTVDEIKSKFCKPGPSDFTREKMQYNALYFALREHTQQMPPLRELDEPPRVAHGKRKASAELVTKLTSEARKMLKKNSDSTAAALQTASKSVDAAELASLETGATDESGVGDSTGGKSPAVYKALQDLVDPKAGAAQVSTAAGGGVPAEAPSPELLARCEEYMQRLGSHNESDVQRVCHIIISDRSFPLGFSRGSDSALAIILSLSDVCRQALRTLVFTYT